MNRSLGILAALLASTILAAPTSARAEVVTIAASDATPLRATYTAAEAAGPGVLLLHMCNSDRSAWKGLARELADQGIHSLALDFRGYGESGGERLEGTAQQQLITETWPADVDAALAFLRARPDVDRSRVGVAGGSCGVNQAVLLAARHPGVVTALALLAGNATDAGTEYLAANPWLPILGAASRDDGRAVEITRWTVGFSSHVGNRFLERETGGHGTEMFAAHGDLEPEIASWFREQLLDHPATPPETITPAPGPSARLWNELRTPAGLAATRDRLRAARAAGEPFALPPEGPLNVEGYARLAAGDTAGAIDLLSFLVEAFPHSANALDSLGDAYLAVGQAEKAAELARKTLDAIPNDPTLDETFATALRDAATAKLGS